MVRGRRRRRRKRRRAAARSPRFQPAEPALPARLQSPMMSSLRARPGKQLFIGRWRPFMGPATLVLIGQPARVGRCAGEPTGRHVESRPSAPPQRPSDPARWHLPPERTAQRHPRRIAQESHRVARPWRRDQTASQHRSSRRCAAGSMRSTPGPACCRRRPASDDGARDRDRHLATAGAFGLPPRRPSSAPGSDACGPSRRRRAAVFSSDKQQLTATCDVAATRRQRAARPAKSGRRKLPRPGPRARQTDEPRASLCSPARRNHLRAASSSPFGRNLAKFGRARPAPGDPRTRRRATPRRGRLTSSSSRCSRSWLRAGV